MEPTTEPATPRRNPVLLLIAGTVLLLILLVKWCNTPHQDSSEKPLPNKEVKAITKQRDQALKRADSLLIVADTAVAHSLQAYALGVEAGKQATALKLETHLKPTTHAQAPATPASVKQLQQYFDEF